LTEWNKQEFAAAWIGHATVLLRIGGKNILTDPVLGGRVGLGLGLATGGPARLVAPAVRLRELPKLDAILISHAHYDHLDRPTLSRLPKSVPVITAAHTRDLIDDLGFKHVTELNWGDSAQLENLTIKAWEVRHWGARNMQDHHRTACSFIIEADGRRVLFGGDTAFGHHFESAGRVDLAILGIGAYNPWEAGHATPEQAWRMADEMRADFVMPMHHSTFRLSHEPMGEPIERLLGAAGFGLDRVVATEIGQSFSLN
jgi:L-ascorbate metabolism protein UlaG (beta-lactamase superfamily)